MSSVKISISLSAELERALGRLATERKEERSRLLETLLRENPLVQKSIEQLREGPMALKKGRKIEELLLLARVARKGWERRLATGEVKLHADEP